MQQLSWYQKNKERAREYNRQRRLRNKEHLNAYHREWSKNRRAADASFREAKNNETAEWKIKNKERVAAYRRAYKQKNRERENAAHEEWKLRNPERWRQLRKEHFVRHRFRYYAKTRDYQRVKAGAVPKWASLERIQEFYRLSAKMTRETGVKHHVDHIVPLRSKLVCGLHCEANLRVIPATENNKKNNRTWPDMPNDRR